MNRLPGPGRHRRQYPAIARVPLFALFFFSSTWSVAEGPAKLDAKGRWTGFEQAEVGRFEQIETEVGTWVVVSGDASVDDKYAQSGQRCLHLSGPTTVIDLDVDTELPRDCKLRFAAERWTAREPFSFRIEQRVGGNWTEIFNGDTEIRVGRSFLSDVSVALQGTRVDRLRFIVTSPAGTGVLMDDIRVSPELKQEIVGVEVVPTTFPVLVGAKACPLVKLRIKTEGSLEPVAIAQVEVGLEDAVSQRDLKSLQLAFSNQGEPFGTARLTFLGEPQGVSSGINSLSLPPGAGRLREGLNDLWVACALNQNAHLDHRVVTTCNRISFSNGQSFGLSSKPSVQRLGVAVRQGGDDGVHTYRIPGLATTKAGSLIAVYDVRRRSGGDLPGDIDVGMSRSVDGGRSWEPMKVIMDMGDDPQWQYDGIGDPAVLVDAAAGTIWVAATWSHGNRSWHGSGPGLSPEETGQLMLARSDDDGVTWSKPINITKQVKRPEWCFLLQGPGKGITMRDGTLVFAAQYQDPPEKARLPHSTILYSKDHGENWQIGTGAFADTTEAQVVEVEPGVLMLNCRYNRESARVVMTTKDMGRSWQEHPTSVSDLIEPRACMASLIDVGRELDDESVPWLLFSNPNHLQQRSHITIKASSDRGRSWPSRHQVLLDEGRGAGYSCMTMIDKQTIGILYEGSQSQLTFQRIPLSDLVSGNP